MIKFENKSLIQEAIEFYKNDRKKDEGLKLFFTEKKFERIIGPLIQLENKINSLKKEDDEVNITGDLFKLLRVIVKKYLKKLEDLTEEDYPFIKKEEIEDSIRFLSEMIS